MQRRNNLLGSKSNGKLQFPLAKSYNDVHAASVNSSRQLLQQPGFSWSMHEGRPIAISSHYTQVKELWMQTQEWVPVSTATNALNLEQMMILEQ